MQPERIWTGQCEAARGIEDEYGTHEDDDDPELVEDERRGTGGVGVGRSAGGSEDP